MLALPYPKRSHLNLNDLAEFINVKPEDLCLILGWLVQTCRAENGAYPILIFESQQGSGKSETMRKTRSLIDPSAIDIRKQPKDTEAVMIAAKNGWIVAYDNLSYLGSSLSDTLCVVSTGAADGKRKNFTDSEEAVYKVKRPLMISSIKEITTQPDLMQRSIIIELPKISQAQRKSETELKEAFEQAHPALLAALCDTLTQGLASNVKLSKLPRMADFAAWAVRCLGQDVLKRYDANLSSHHDVAIDASPIGRLLMEFISKTSETIKATPSELHKALVKHLEDADSKPSSINKFPKNANALSNQINQIRPNLFELGYSCEQTRDSKGRYWELKKLSPEALPNKSADLSSSSSHRHKTDKNAEKIANYDDNDNNDDLSANLTGTPKEESFLLEPNEVVI